MKNEETSRETPRNNAEVRMQKACHSVIGRPCFAIALRDGKSVSFRKHSSFFILHSAFSRAFTLLEVMIAIALFGLVMAGTIEVYIMCNKLWHATSLSMETSRLASLAIQRMVYGLGTNDGLRSAASISVNTNVHKDGCSLFLNYWDTTVNSPPAANNDAYNR
jgi:prepilin-type N-terminal cleavage/methylation domain-containing protein